MTYKPSEMQCRITTSNSLLAMEHSQRIESNNTTWRALESSSTFVDSFGQTQSSTIYMYPTKPSMLPKPYSNSIGSFLEIGPSTNYAKNQQETIYEFLQRIL